MRKLLLTFILCLLTPFAFSAPSNTVSVPNSFSASTTIVSSEVNANNNEIQTKYNAHTHNDITALGTVTSGNWNGSTIAVGYGGTGQTTATAAFDALAPSSSTGDVIVYNGTDNARLGAGSLGHALISNGPGALPSYQAVQSYGDVTYKSGSFTRDTTTASGNQSVTGLGFKPRAIIFFASVHSATGEASWGFDDGVSPQVLADGFDGSADTWDNASSGTYSIFSLQGSGNNYQGKILTFDTDGFTVAWTKTSSPTGTLTVSYIAYR